jgi:sugar (pentulose or hexulose) kinase
MVNGGSCVDWVLRTVRLSPGEGIDRTVCGVPPGSRGLRFRPLLSPGGGAGLPPAAAGRLDGLRLNHAAPDILRAAIEGLAFELGRYVQILKDAGMAPDRLVLCGKAAGSAATPRIVADVTGLPVDCVAVAETAAFGAAIQAAVLCGPDAPLRDTVHRMVPPPRRELPGQHRERYAELFRDYMQAAGDL